jgi:integrase
MAGLWKHPKSQYWTAIYYDGEGNKKRVTTKMTDRKQAQRFADQLEDLAKAGRKKRLVESHARKVISDIVERYTGEQMHFHSTRQWFAEWLAGKKGTIDSGTHRRYEKLFEKFLAHLGAKADQTVAGVTVTDIRSFRDARSKAGHSAVTVNLTVRNILASPFAAAKRLGYIQTNPCSAVEPLRDTAGGRREPFTADQIKALLGVANNEWQGVIMLGYFSAMRLRDITTLEWSAVQGEILKVMPKKTARLGTMVTIPLHPEFIKWLRDQPTGIGKAKLFPALSEKTTGGWKGLSELFSELMKSADIKGATLREGVGKGRKTSTLSFHSLRHSMISALANAGVAPELRKKLSGHSDDASHANYTHHELEQLRAAIAKLPSIKSK